MKTDNNSTIKKSPYHQQTSNRHQGTNVEATVALPLNQGTNPQSGGIRLRGPFFGYFFGQTKKYEAHRR